MNRIPLSIPNISGNEEIYVSKALQEGWVSTGSPQVNTFENAFSEYLGGIPCVACQSGTAAIHVALILAGVENGDEVIVPTLSFVATVNPVRYVGASPIFMDCDSHLCMDVIKVGAFLNENAQVVEGGKCINKITGKSIKALIVTHVFGEAADMEGLLKICQKWNLVLIEDAAEAVGSRWSMGEFAGKALGTIGEFGILSFNGNKIMTTGGGGMLICHDEQMAKKAKYLFTQAKDDPIHYRHNEIGFNYRMTALQAAVGMAQLEKLEEFIEIKRRNYLKYELGIRNITGLELMEFKSTVRSNQWFYSLIIDESLYGRSAEELRVFLDEHGIESRPIWELLHLQVPYLQFQAFDIKNALEIQRKVLNIPCSTSLSEKEIECVISVLMMGRLVK